jgi:hypothetical protein
MQIFLINAIEAARLFIFSSKPSPDERSDMRVFRFPRVPAFRGACYRARIRGTGWRRPVGSCRLLL